MKVVRQTSSYEFLSLWVVLQQAPVAPDVVDSMLPKLSRLIGVVKPKQQFEDFYFLCRMNTLANFCWKVNIGKHTHVEALVVSDCVCGRSSAPP